MEPALKQRLVGAAVLVALAVIFLPMLVEGPAPDSAVSSVPLKMPAAPTDSAPVRELPLVVPATPAVGQGAVLGMPAPPNDSTGVADAAPAASASPPPLAASTEATVAATPAATAPNPAPAATAVTPTKPATLPAGAGMGDYIVSLGRYASAANADALVTRLRAAKLPARAQAVTLATGPGYAVTLGPFEDRVRAEQARLAALKVRADLPARVLVNDATPASASNKPAAAKGAAATTAPVTPAPVAAVTRPASVAQGFVVQLVAVADRGKADALRGQLRQAGITAYTEQVSSEHGVLSRVRAGPVPSRSEAEQLQAAIRKRFGINGSIRPYP